MTRKEEIEYLAKLGQRLRQLRSEKKLTQSDCGVDDRTIRRIENSNENFNPSYLTLAEISKALGISLSEFLEF